LRNDRALGKGKLIATTTTTTFVASGHPFLGHILISLIPDRVGSGVNPRLIVLNQVLVHPLGSFASTQRVWLKTLPCWLCALIFAAPQLFIFVQVIAVMNVYINYF